LFHYLRLFHRPVWRLLERQPLALMLLHRVLNNSPDPIPSNKEDFKEEDQRMLREFFERAFFHVLQDDAKYKSDEDVLKYHRSMDLSQAVQLFQERQDSKRSDEFFIKQFSIVIDKDTDTKLEDNFLYLPVKKENKAEKQPEDTPSSDLSR